MTTRADRLPWAIEFARDYRQENRARDALRLLADAVQELRAENRVLRELIVEALPSRTDEGRTALAAFVEGAQQ